MRRADRYSSIFLLGLCVLFLVKARKFSPLSGLFPRVIIYILAGLSVLLLLRSFFWKKDGPAFDGAAFRNLPSLISLVIIIAWVSLVPLLGFLTTSLICFPLLTVYLDYHAPRKKIIERLIYAVVLPLVLYFVFTKILYVPFPEGLLI